MGLPCRIVTFLARAALCIGGVSAFVAGPAGGQRPPAAASRADTKALASRASLVDGGLRGPAR
jgi:hypothetical protein